MRILLFVFAFMSFGCQEYDLRNQGEQFGEPRAPFLATPIKQDRMIQTTSPAVDVLWVIDNSCSMSDKQNKLAQNFPLFMNYFVDSGLDWHVGVVSTDMDNADHQGKLRSANGYRYIDETVPNPSATFTAMAKMGTSGSSWESGRAASYTGLELRKNGYNAGFLRKKAALSVVVISDENDYSGNSPISLNEFIDYLLNLKGSTDDVTFSSIVGPPQSCWDAVEPGTQYISVTDAVGGIKWSICSEDWDQILDELGMQAAGLKREFFLTERPIVDTIEVWVIEDGTTLTFEMDDGVVDPKRAFTYDAVRNSISFVNYVPDELAEVFIEYEILSAAQYGDDTGE
ncbi:MAG: hypothetical protein HN348_07400 [Proteobacteria bacterium]|nr:hypothetical protein [Pseudomonadota bacterium]